METFDVELIAQKGYSTFQGGFRPGTLFIPPHWLNLEPWQRDAMVCAALQMKVELLAASRTTTLPDGDGIREKDFEAYGKDGQRVTRGEWLIGLFDEAIDEWKKQERWFEEDYVSEPNLKAMEEIMRDAYLQARLTHKLGNLVLFAGRERKWLEQVLKSPTTRTAGEHDD